MHGAITWQSHLGTKHCWILRAAHGCWALAMQVEGSPNMGQHALTVHSLRQLSKVTPNAQQRQQDSQGRSTFMTACRTACTV